MSNEKRPDLSDELGIAYRAVRTALDDVEAAEMKVRDAEAALRSSRTNLNAAQSKYDEVVAKTRANPPRDSKWWEAARAVATRPA